jgi:nucleotide-binding universal stress UspA family protein
MKMILVPVEQHEMAAHAPDLAARTARLFASLVEGFALRLPPLTGVPWDAASAAILTRSEWDASQNDEPARALFERVMRAHGVEGPEGVGPKGTAAGAEAARWRWGGPAEGGDGYLGSHGRAFDLTVVGQPVQGGSSITTLEAALFDSGGPILIAPPHEVASFAERVVIAWNGSSETARTIAFARPLLRRARRVVLLADDGSVGHRPPGELIRQRLAGSGIAAELVTLSEGGIRSGERILREAAELGCDLLVKGAYTQSRLRQMIFGGATSHILANAKVPVFMAH